MKKSSRHTSAIDAGYSRAFLADYGRTLSRSEIRLVQGFRGLTRSDRAKLLQLVSRWVTSRVAGRRSISIWAQAVAQIQGTGR